MPTGAETDDRDRFPSRPVQRRHQVVPVDGPGGREKFGFQIIGARNGSEAAYIAQEFAYLAFTCGPGTQARDCCRIADRTPRTPQARFNTCHLTAPPARRGPGGDTRAVVTPEW